jgi:hypothetical protein
VTAGLATAATRLPGLDALCATVREATSVVAVGARTQWEVGGRSDPAATEVCAPSGVVSYDPRELTVTVAAGTTVAELDAALAAQGQECPLDPRTPDATVGGVLAAGLSGARRLRNGPIRDRVLEVRFVTADGRVVKGGGPTVKTSAATTSRACSSVRSAPSACWSRSRCAASRSPQLQRGAPRTSTRWRCDGASSAVMHRVRRHEHVGAAGRSRR